MGVCRSFWKQVSTDGKTSSWRFMLPLSLSWDHRVIDGASAARFNNHFAALLATCAASSSEKTSRHGNDGRSQGSGHRRLQGRAGIELLVNRATGEGRGRAGHARIRQATMDVPNGRWLVKTLQVKVGDKVSEGSLILRSRRGPTPVPAAEGAGSAGLTQPLPRAGEGAAPWRARAAQRRARAAQLGGGGRRARAAQRQPRNRRRAGVRRQGRRRVRDARPGRRTGRLLGRVPFRRPRHEDGIDRALRDAGRRLPQRRLHSVEGAAAYGGGDGRGEGTGRPRHRLRCAADRHRQAARVQGWRGPQAHRRPRRHGQGAQGRGRARGRPVPRFVSRRSRTDLGGGTGQDRREETIRFQKAIIAAGSQR